MFRTKTDRAERQPQFDEYMRRVDAQIDDGAFEQIDPALLRLRAGAVAVGLTKKAELRVPRDYDPAAGPAVLMVGPDEQRKINPAHGVRASLRCMGASINGTHWPDGAFTGERQWLKNLPVVAEAGIGWQSAEHRTRLIQVPACLVLPAGRTEEKYYASLFGYALERWRFLLHDAPGLYDDQHAAATGGKLYDDGEISIMAARAAFNASYRIEQSLGYHADMPTSEELAEAYFAAEPCATAQAIRHDFVTIRQRRGRTGQLSHALAARTITYLFADYETGAVTDGERRAYYAAGYR